MKRFIFILCFISLIEVGAAHAGSLDHKVIAALGVKAQDVVCLGWADMKGNETSIGLKSSYDNCERLPHAEMQALFVKWQDGNETEYADALIEDQNGFSSIWRAVLSGPNFRTINDISLDQEKDQKWLSITIYQTAMPPAPSSKDKSKPPVFFRPGPPL